MAAGLISDPGEYNALTKRSLTAETCRRWGYFTTTYNNETVQVASYRSPETGEVVAQKLRFKDKKFTILGDMKQAGLFGQNIGSGHKRIIIVEGEIDAMSVAQALNHRWPVASIPNGAAGARKAISKALQWLMSFEQVIFCFDTDEPGQSATTECVALLPPGKAFVAKLPLKDPNEMLQAGRLEELVQCLWGAQPYRPDGIVKVSDIHDEVMRDPEQGLPYFLPELTEITYGRRYGELLGVGAGTGVGKTDFICQQMAYDLDVLKLPVACFMLEQKPAQTVLRLIGKLGKKLFHIPDGSWTKDEKTAALAQLEQNENFYLYDNFGATDWQVIMDRIRYLHHTHGVKLFYLDHLTALVAGQDEERVALEKIMSELGSLVTELGIWVLFVSHLATPDGKPHEEGGRVAIRHFKGSRAIGFWSHNLIGLERDQQSGEDQRHQSTLRILKERETGRATGKTLTLQYDEATGITSCADPATAFPPLGEGKDF